MTCTTTISPSNTGADIAAFNGARTGQTSFSGYASVINNPANWVFQDGSGDQRSTVFANALQDRYALKKTNNSASLGVGVLGSVSMPIGSSDDSMVKVASETVTAQKFYERFFTLVEQFLPADAKKAAHIEEKPKTDLGVPEPKVTPAPAAAPPLGRRAVAPCTPA